LVTLKDFQGQVTTHVY